ncbi:hypothetical protein GCM10018966_020690 [Streptomyces yanii]
MPPGVRTTPDRIQQAGAHEVALGPLADQAVAQIAEDVLGAVPDPDVLRAGAAVAHRWGFCSPSRFSRTFRGAYGMSPGE